MLEKWPGNGEMPVGGEDYVCQMLLAGVELTADEIAVDMLSSANEEETFLRGLDKIKEMERLAAIEGQQIVLG